MPRRLFLLLLFLALVLAACKSTSQAGTTTAEINNTPKATNTTAGPTTAPKQAATLALPGAAPSVPGCTVVSYMPTPDPTSLFPAITEDDYYRGPLTATVKLIEYSDFQ